MRSLLSGRECWNALEGLARERKGVGPEYEICELESFPHDGLPGWSRTKVVLGEKVTRANGKTVWVGFRRLWLTAEEVEAYVHI